MKAGGGEQDFWIFRAEGGGKALLALVLMVVNIIGHRSNVLTLGFLLIVVGQIIVFFGIRNKDKE